MFVVKKNYMFCTKHAVKHFSRHAFETYEVLKSFRSTLDIQIMTQSG